MIACMEMKAPILQVYRSKQDFELERKNYPRQLCFDHFSILMHRMMLQLCRNRDHLYLKIYLYVFLGFIIGGTFNDMGYDGYKSIYNLGFCFTTVLIFLYIPTLPILLWFPEVLVLVERECFNGWYNISSYFLALTITKIAEQVSSR
ncbi:PREDICTED: ATP-binding cassette sub-family G member 1-like, partial [Dinoponera quadriceps]|uniref:ATP-binding cassette sub-family G member 1-like n=1 Tax=Dinoponera quadriceps TaxID=609295 RepID=A0A6P3XTG7_DINQU